MKKIYTKISFLFSCLLVQGSLSAQCGTAVSGGTATGFVFSFARIGVNPVAADKDLNTVGFIHRTNTVTAGHMGQFVYDISTNGGAAWATNPALLNPLGTSQARFPSLTIYNPPANTNPNNAYVGYMAATFNTATAVYNGVVSGVRQISGTGNTENYNQPISGSSFIAASVVKGAPGVFWAVDGLFNGTLVNGLTIYKGVWNSSTNDIVWSNNFSVNPGFNTGFNPAGQAPSNWNIAFDPTGTIGYMSCMGHLASGPGSPYSYYPILWKTTNGGNSWTGPIVVDVNQFSCLTDNVTPGVYYPTASFEHDLIVDANGNPHIITLLMLGNNAYAVYYGLWHHLFDITLRNGVWAAHDLGNAMAGRGMWGTAPNNVDMDLLPRIARTADGTKIFYTWADNSTYTAGQANLSPNLFSKGYNVTTDMWTPTRDFTSCNPATAGKIIYPNLAPEVLEPSTNQYKLAIVYGEFSTPANDPGIDVNYKFLDNITYASTEFSVPTSPANISIVPGPSLVICPGSTISVGTASTQGQWIWSTGATTNSISVTTGTATSYSVVAQQACLVGTASIAVANLTLNANPLNSNICNGSSETFTVLGNALLYTWAPGNATGTNVALNINVNTVTLTAEGSGGCTLTQTIGINLLPQPTLSIAGNNTICSTQVLTQVVSGAQTYVWSDNSTNATFTDTPMTNTVYTVIGTAANTCTNTQTVSVVVLPSPTVTAASSASAVCAGQTVALMSSGAVTYSWNASASPSSTTTTINATTVFTVTGAAANLCETSKTISVIGHPLPSMTVTPTKTVFCKGEKTKLTASGASTYTWITQGLLTPSVQVNPTTTTSYAIIGKSTQGCLNTYTYTLNVEQCVGLEQHKGGNYLLNVYPNPNNGTFIIKGDADIDFDIVNELGQVIKTVSLNAANYHETSVKDLAGGIYFIVGKQENLHVKHKIVVSN